MGLYGGMAQTVMLWALMHSPPRGGLGACSPRKFGIFDSLRVILDSDFGASLSEPRIHEKPEAVYICIFLFVHDLA